MSWNEQDEKRFAATMRGLYPGVPETAWGSYRTTAMNLKGYQRLDVDPNTEREIREDTVRRLLSVGGPLHQYLHPEAEGATFSRFKELVNETLGTDFSYTDLYNSRFAGWLFNAGLEWSEADSQSAGDVSAASSEEVEGDAPSFYFSL